MSTSVKHTSFWSPERRSRDQQNRRVSHASLHGEDQTLTYWRLPDTSRRQWMAQRAALVELSQRLGELGAPLIVRVGSVVEILMKIHASVGIARLLAHEETGNLWTFRRDIAVHHFCRGQARLPH